MGKKVISMVITGLLIATILPIGASFIITKDSSIQTPIDKTEIYSISYSSDPIPIEIDGFIKITLDGTTTYLLEPQRPMLPITVKTFQIPFKSTQIKVLCQPKCIESMNLKKEVVPARLTLFSQGDKVTTYEKDPAIYQSIEFYPDTCFSYDLGAGRNENDIQVTFVKVICYPVRYSPLNNEIQYTGGFDIQVSYTEPQTPQLASAADDYDMVIIAPAKFQDALESLVTHKNSKGIRTMFKSVEDILAEYEGFDPPEQIKYFIEHEYYQSNLTYALLVGGLKSHLYAKDKDTSSAGWKAWWVPVRYVNMPHESDEGCLSDLYYGCLYDAMGEFDSWDSNGDGVYAAWGASGVLRDTLDLYPEVYVSRLPCVTIREVKSVVNKIITYENSGPEDKPWFNNFVGIAGKTGEYYQGKPDGEYLCDLAYNYTKNTIPTLELTRCYSTLRDVGGRTPIAKDILKSLNEGAGFVDFQGHGNTYAWNTIWHDGEYPDDWTGGFNIILYPFVRNRNELPIVVVGGCHNGLYNVSMIQGILDKGRAETNYFCYGVPAPFCFSAGLVLKNRGGAIASTGSTGYGIGWVGIPVSLSGKLEVNFFYEIGSSSTHLAQAYGQSIQRFISEEDIGQTEAFVITNWALFGDPSLRIGGYSS